MAAGNLVVKLLLDSGAFDTNIKTAKAQIQGFEKVGKSIVGTLGKFAAGMGIATTALGALETAINSSVGGTQAFQTAMDVCKTSVDNFFYSLTTGDFSAFATGMDVVIKKAKEAKNALLDVQYSEMAGGYVAAQLRSEYDTYMQKAKDTRLPLQERQDYANRAIQKTEEFERLVKGQTDLIIKAVATSATKDTPFSSSSVDIPMLTELAQKVAMQGREKTLEEYEPMMKEYQLAIEQLAGVRFSRDEWAAFIAKFDILLKYYGGAIGGAISGMSNTQIGEYVNEWLYQVFGVKNLTDSQIEGVSKITKQYAPAVVGTSLLNNKNAEQVDNIFKQLTQLGTLKSQLASWKQGTNELASLFTSGDNNGGSKNVGGSGGNKIKEVEVYPEFSVLGLQKEIADAKKLRDTWDYRDPYGFIAANQEVERLEKRLESLLALIANPDNKIEMPDFGDMENDLEFSGLEQVVQNTDDWAQSLNTVASILGSITNMSNEGAAAWLAWGANILSTMATAIPLLDTFFAKEAAAATATAAKSAAETPVVGWITAIAAIAAMGAAFASMPKFASGGIVDSPFTSGDRVLARLNGGEMVLNKHQQSNLFNLLDSGANNGSSNVKFRVEGKDLVGVLSNYNNKLKKIM